MLDVGVIDDAAAGAAALDPRRARILAELREPASASVLAKRLGLARQKVNYHLRELERHGLVTVAEERSHGGLTERLMVANAASHVVSPAAMVGNAPDPTKVGDRMSARYVIALASRVIREVGGLLGRAEAQRRRMATLAIDTEIGFASADAQAEFANELSQAITCLAQKYHQEGGRPFRLTVVSHPTPKEES